MNIDKILDEMQTEFDRKRVGAEIWDDEEGHYVECIKSVDPVKQIIKDFGFDIEEEHECSGSDYDSYIIRLKIK